MQGIWQMLSVLWLIYGALRLGFRRNFLLCISSLISSQGLSKVFWIFKIWHRCIPMHILAWTDCVKVQVSFDIRTRVYFRVSLHLANDIKPWNKNQRKRIKRDRGTGIIQKLLSYVNCREIHFSYTWHTSKYPRQQDENDASIYGFWLPLWYLQTFLWDRSQWK